MYYTLIIRIVILFVSSVPSVLIESLVVFVRDTGVQFDVVTHRERSRVDTRLFTQPNHRVEVSQHAEARDSFRTHYARYANSHTNHKLNYLYSFVHSLSAQQYVHAAV